MDTSCSFVNTVGVRCPRVPYNGTTCFHHSCQICGAVTVCDGYCAQHVHERPVPKVAPVDDGPEQCTFISESGRCSNRTYDKYCKVHRCAHGSMTFRGELHCTDKIVEGEKYCHKHQNSCDCFWEEDDTGCGVCCEDIHQCTRPFVVKQPRRMCEFHYKLYLFKKSAEY